MGNKPAQSKRKKKGRPSLLDLQKRRLRLQKQQQQEQQQTNKNPNPNPNRNPYLRYPNAASGSRSTRRNPNPNADDDDDDDSSNGKRREKKLKLVHRIPNPASDSDDRDRDKEERNNSSKGTGALQGEPSDSGPTTPLPNKKLLEFILDRLQKKDTYGVFSEPVDPDELPDYHEIIKHPMDFATVRKKLSSGAYANLEQFEEDVFLISSNAMQYNASDTIYHRQARAIQELAKKNFENLRQESDDNEPEPKTVARRGRPSSKNIKQAIGRPPIDHASSDFSSNATLANAGDGAHWSNLTNDLSRKGSTSDRAGGLRPISARSSYNLRQTELFGWTGLHKSESNEEFSGYGPKGNSSKYGKRFPVIDENRRNTYKEPQSSTFVEPSIFTTFDGETKQLLPIGLHIEHSYARSLTRFAANLGPIGWAIAAKKIERVLPPGTKFGRGWTGDSGAPRLQHSQPPLLSESPPRPSSSEPNVSTCTTVSRGNKLPQKMESHSNDFATEVGHLRRTQPPVSISVASNGFEAPGGPNPEGGSNLMIGGGGGGGGANNIQSKSPYQFHQNLGIQPTANGYTALVFDVPSQVGKMVRPARPSGPFCSDLQMTHSRALDMVSRSNIDSNNSFHHQHPVRHLDAERAKLMKQDSVPPDLNVRFQSPGSPLSGMKVDTQQPDLALQL